MQSLPVYDLSVGSSGQVVTHADGYLEQFFSGTDADHFMIELHKVNQVIYRIARPLSGSDPEYRNYLKCVHYIIK